MEKNTPKIPVLYICLFFIYFFTMHDFSLETKPFPTMFTLCAYAFM